MLNDSQQIGHSKPSSSLLAHEETSSSEQSGLVVLAFAQMFFEPDFPVVAFDMKLHILMEGLTNYERNGSKVAMSRTR